MPYTQANPLDQTVQDAFDLKVKMLEARGSGKEGSEEATYYFNARTPWIKMTSCVDVVSSTIRDKFELQTATSLAEKYVLGLTKPGDAFSGHNVDKARTLGDPDNNSYGIRPQPGIQNMDIVSYNKYGSLRKGTINFQVWTKEDLDACEMLYMRPGMSILLEWGWSLYPETGENGEYLIKDMGPGLSREVLAGKYKSLHQVLAAIVKKQKAYNYGYDAIFGFVKNFKWTVRPDGGYDCSTELVTAGELVESINMAKPLADVDVQLYSTILDALAAKTRGDAVKGSYKLDKFTPGVSTGISVTFDRANKVYEDAMKQLGDVPSPETQTVLSAFIAYDINRLANVTLDGTLTTAQKKEAIPNLQYLSLKDLSETQEHQVEDPETSKKAYIPITTRLVSKRGTRVVEDDILRVNWRDPAYLETNDGKVQLTDDDNDFVVIAEHLPQTYIKYGLLLEILNNFMLQQNDKTVTPFDIEGGSAFTVYPNLTLSLDPSICLLPREESVLRQATGLEASDSVTPNIYDIRINTALLEDLISSSGLAKVTQEGIPYLRIFDMIQTLNTKINECTGNLLNLDIQYYDHLGTFSVIDRKTFSSNKKYNRLDVYGLKSLMHSIDITSALTPDMSSALAISAQTKVTNADSHSAGFLRFNDGIRDRVITDRSLDGTVVKDVNTEYANTNKDFDPKAEVSEIFQIYQIIYGNLFWAEASFPYVKNKFVEFVKQITGNTEQGVVGQVVIPFSTGLTMDGMSGFRIMNGFTLDPKILPYKYNIKGGVGQIITGLQATVDSTSWKTQLKTKFYNLEAGTLPENTFPQAEGSDFVSDSNYVRDYAVLLSSPEFSNISTYVDQATLSIRGNYNQSNVSGLKKLVKEHYEDYWGGNFPNKGTVKESTDVMKSVGTANFVTDNIGLKVDETSAIQLYWTNYRTSYGKTEAWMNHDSYPWSAVYVSFMMSDKANLESKVTFIGQIPEGYGSPKWIKASSHKGYVDPAKNNREAGVRGGNWIAFALGNDYDVQKALEGSEFEEPKYIAPTYPFGTKIKAQEGDVLVRPRDGKYTDSHGVIVTQVGYAGWVKGLNEFECGTEQIIVAHGNSSNTNKVEPLSGVIDNSQYYLPTNPHGYLIVLKRFD